MIVKCVLVKFKDIIYDFSPKCCKVIDWNKNVYYIPKSQILKYEEDNKSESLWIPEWLAKEKSMTYSIHNCAKFDTITKRQLPEYKVIKHKPERIEFSTDNEIEELLR